MNNNTNINIYYRWKKKNSRKKKLFYTKLQIICSLLTTIEKSISIYTYQWYNLNFMTRDTDTNDGTIHFQIFPISLVKLCPFFERVTTMLLIKSTIPSFSSLHLAASLFPPAISIRVPPFSSEFPPCRVPPPLVASQAKESARGLAKKLAYILLRRELFYTEEV